jgi:ABC-type lipoprotein release transport system permease subunit
VGRALLVCRLVLRDVRRRRAEAALLMLTIAAAATTLTLGFALHGVTDHPYERTREATAGPDVVASLAPVPVGPDRVVPVDPAGLDALVDAPDVVDHSGPYPAAVADLAVDGVTAEAWVQGRDRDEAPVDQPELTEGDWVEDGGAVVEAAFADAVGVGAGDRITLNGRSFRVVGVAVTAASSYTNVCFGQTCESQVVAEPPDSSLSGLPPGDPIPEEESVPAEGGMPPSDAGLVWLTQADIRDIAPSERALSYALNLNLAGPAAAPAFVDAHAPEGYDSPFLASWQDIRWANGKFMRGQQMVLTAGGWLLALLAVASIAVLVGGRMADETRRVGLLKAVGGTPGLVTVVLLAEYMALAAVAAAAGLAIGRLAAPLLTDPGAGLVGSAGAPSLTLSTVGLVTAAALGIAALAAVVPAARAARTSTVHALADRARPPRRARWLIALSARLPVPVLIGVRLVAGRPRRAVLGVASVVVTVSGVVAVLAARAQIAADFDGGTGVDPGFDRVDEVLLVITVMLVALAAVNAVVVTWSTALDARRSSAVARALGATPAQVTAGLAAAQVLPALTGVVLGIPGGLVLWSALSNDEAANPPWWQLLAVAAGAVLVVAGITSVPARVAARRPTAPILQAELT